VPRTSGASIAVIPLDLEGLDGVAAPATLPQQARHQRAQGFGVDRCPSSFMLANGTTG
jgi:hypothetical protein